jgi:hypothetical protein
MPNIVCPINDTFFTIERPVTFKIVRELLDITRISNKTPISFAGPEEKMGQQGSTVEPNQAENRWAYDERVFIEVQEEYDLESLGSTATTRIEYPAFMNDEFLGVYMRPIYSKTKLSISFKYRARDKNQADKWRNDIRTRTSQMRDVNLHEIVYHFRIPEAMLNILKEIYKMRENVAGYGQTYNDYFTSKCLRNVGLITNQGMTDGVWAVNEKQIRIAGFFDFTGAPEKSEKEGDNDTWTTSFTYNVMYMKPLECNMRYPLVVHNQLIGSDYRPQAPDYRIEDQPADRTLSGEWLKKFESDTRVLSARGDTGIVLPSFDDFVPKSVLISTVRVFTAAVLLDPTRPRYLFNLGDLGDYQLHPLIIDFLKSGEYTYLGKDYQSVLSLTLYRNVTQQDTDSLFVDANLDVWSASDLDLRLQYHVRLGLMTNFNYIRTNGLQRLQSKPVAGLIVKAVNGAMSGINYIRKDIKTRVLEDIDMRSVLGRTVNLATYRGGNLKTVMELFIRSERAANP